MTFGIFHLFLYFSIAIVPFRLDHIRSEMDTMRISLKAWKHSMRFSLFLQLLLGMLDGFFEFLLLVFTEKYLDGVLNCSCYFQMSRRQFRLKYIVFNYLVELFFLFWCDDNGVLVFSDVISGGVFMIYSVFIEDLLSLFDSICKALPD